MADKPSDEGITIVVPGADTGGGDSGGGTSSAPAVDPRKAYRAILFRLRLPVGLFADLISRAAGEQWGADEFMWALSNTQQFNRLFPHIGALLDQGMGVQQAIATWRGMATAYENELRDKGLWGFARSKLSKANIGLAIARGIDVEEMVFRMSIAEQAVHSEDVRRAFNAILKNRGDAQLDKQGWVRFLLGKSEAKLYDIWEGTQLLAQLGPEGLKIRQARRLGKLIGEPGQAVDVSDALSSVRRIQRTFGTQQLADAGISTNELALAVLSEGIRKPKAKARADAVVAQLEQLARNQQAAAGAVDRTASFTRGGRPVSEAAPAGELAGIA